MNSEPQIGSYKIPMRSHVIGWFVVLFILWPLGKYAFSTATQHNFTKVYQKLSIKFAMI
jgi:hypothetical protein